MRGTSGAPIFRAFANRGAYYLGDINAIHPFREGNGRTQREFIRELGSHNGGEIDWTQVSSEQMIEASRRSLRVDNSGLEEVLKMARANDKNHERERDRGRQTRTVRCAAMFLKTVAARITTAIILPVWGEVWGA